MEDQSHLTLGEKRNEPKHKKKLVREKEKEEEEEEEHLEASHPSMKCQRPQEHWISMTGNHRRWTHCPELSLWLQSALPVTSILVVGQVIENRYVYGAAQTPTQ